MRAKKPKFSKRARKATLPQGRSTATSAQADFISRLKYISLFDSFTAEELSSLAPALEEKRVSAGSILFEEGSKGSSFFLIEKGKILIYKGVSSQRQQDIAILSDGDFFGEMSLVESKPRSASAKTLEDTLLVIVHGKNLLSWVERDIKKALHVGAKFLRVLSERLRTTTEELNSLNNLTLSLISIKDPVKIWDCAIAEFKRVLTPEVAKGGALFIYNPYLEEYTHQGHWGVVPSDYLVNRKTAQNLSEGLKSFLISENNQDAYLFIFEPKEHVLLKKTPLIQLFARIIYQAYINAQSVYEQELQLRLKNQTISA